MKHDELTTLKHLYTSEWQCVCVCVCVCVVVVFLPCSGWAGGREPRPAGRCPGWRGRSGCTPDARSTWTPSPSRGSAVLPWVPLSQSVCYWGHCHIWHVPYTQNNVLKSRYSKTSRAQSVSSAQLCLWVSVRVCGTCLSPLQNLSNTRAMLPPFSMEITLVWSSSFTQIRKFFSLLCLRSDTMPAGPHVTKVCYSAAFTLQIRFEIRLSSEQWKHLNTCKRMQSELF